MKALPLTSCVKCPNFMESPFPTSDSFERPSYWWCTHSDVEEINEDEETEKRKIFIKKDYKLDKLRLIQGYVEWHEENKIPIPKFCPLKNI